VSAHVTHPDYSACTFPPGGGDRCACGGVRHWHASPPYGCDDCKECTAFDAAPLGLTEAQVRAQVVAQIEVARDNLQLRADVADDQAMKVGLNLAIRIAGAVS